MAEVVKNDPVRPEYGLDTAIYHHFHPAAHRLTPTRKLTRSRRGRDENENDTASNTSAGIRRSSPLAQLPQTLLC